MTKLTNDREESVELSYNSTLVIELYSDNGNELESIGNITILKVGVSDSVLVGNITIKSNATIVKDLIRLPYYTHDEIVKVIGNNCTGIYLEPAGQDTADPNKKHEENHPFNAYLKSTTHKADVLSLLKKIAHTLIGKGKVISDLGVGNKFYPLGLINHLYEYNITLDAYYIVDKDPAAIDSALLGFTSLSWEKKPKDIVALQGTVDQPFILNEMIQTDGLVCAFNVLFYMPLDHIISFLRPLTEHQNQVFVSIHSPIFSKTMQMRLGNGAEELKKRDVINAVINITSNSENGLRGLNILTVPSPAFVNMAASDVSFALERALLIANGKNIGWFTEHELYVLYLLQFLTGKKLVEDLTKLKTDAHNGSQIETFINEVRHVESHTIPYLLNGEKFVVWQYMQIVASKNNDKVFDPNNGRKVRTDIAMPLANFLQSDICPLCFAAYEGNINAYKDVLEFIEIAYGQLGEKLEVTSELLVHAIKGWKYSSPSQQPEHIEMISYLIDSGVGYNNTDKELYNYLQPMLNETSRNNLFQQCEGVKCNWLRKYYISNSGGNDEDNANVQGTDSHVVYTTSLVGAYQGLNISSEG